MNNQQLVEMETKSNKRTKLSKDEKKTQDTLPPNRGSRKNVRLDPTSLFINKLQCLAI